MTITRTQWTLGALLAATLAAVAWVGGGDPPATDTAATARDGRSSTSTASVAARRRASAEDQVTASGVEPSRLIRVMSERRVGDPFGSVSFVPPPPAPKPAITVVAAPPPPAPPPPPRAPTAPPFPWTFMGRMIEDPQNPSVFLSRSERLTVAHIGDTLESVWRINGMDARGLRVEYLPLKSTSTVNLASGSDSVGPSNSSAAATNGNLALQRPQQIEQAQAPALEAPQAEAKPAAAPAPSAVSGIEVSSGMGTPLNDR